MKLFIICFLILFSSQCYCQESKPLNEKFEMKQYYLVFLRAGPNRTQDSATSATIMKEHLAHLTKMYNENKMSMCGPMMDEGDIRGICVYHIEDEKEVRELAESDPAVKAGRLIVEVHPWYSAKGMVLK